MDTPTVAARLDDDQARHLLYSSRLARVAFSVHGEPFVVAATVVVSPDCRMVLSTDDSYAVEHLDGRHVAVEVDGRFGATGASWYVVARGTAKIKQTAVADHRHGEPTAPWVPPQPCRTFVVAPTTITGQVLGHTEVDHWFAGVPAS
jgi:hypothetical protein